MRWWAGFGPWVLAWTGLEHLRKDARDTGNSGHLWGGSREQTHDGAGGKLFTGNYSVPFEYCNLHRSNMVNY